MIATPWYQPYAGLPLTIQVLFWIAFAVIIISFVHVMVLWVRAQDHSRRSRYGRHGRHSPRRLPDADESQFLWVFMVPALNEEVTIADSVTRLAAVNATNKIILVIDDGSDDATPQVLSGIDAPELRVLRRDLPNARQGKSAALNTAWTHLHELLQKPDLSHWESQDVIVVVVDADGRLSVDSPGYFARHFVDPRMGGVQSLVHIYNKTGPLTWAQDVEFDIAGFIYQLGRSSWGTANMGGNGQANRLAALDSVVDDTDGPWRQKLTEDQDVGIRLLQRGWRGAQDNDATVHQQGLSSLRPLYRQRTRWAQGGWESMTLLRGSSRLNCSLIARIDNWLYLLTPVLQLISGVGLATALVIALTTDLPLWSTIVPMLLFFLTLSFLPALLGLLSRAEGPGAKAAAVLTVLPYTVYSWLIYPVVLRALIRIAVGRSGWAKTAREPLSAPMPADAGD